MENEFTTLLTATDSKWSVDDVVNLSNSDRDVIYDGVIDYLTEEEFTFEFLVKVRDSYLEYETLTVGQVKGVINCIKANLARENEVVFRTNVREIVDFFSDTFPQAKRPKLTLAWEGKDYRISRAPLDGKNAGSLYVKEVNMEEHYSSSELSSLGIYPDSWGNFDNYLGKIDSTGEVDRKLERNTLVTEMLQDLAEDPQGAVMRFGKLRGQCAICGKVLDKEESIRRGIGPICAGRMGL